MPDDRALAHFQAVLLDLLDRGGEPHEIIESLRRDSRLAEYADYIASFEPRMMAVAVELIAKWGQRDGGNLTD